ncbi:unnamed protein product [Trypanosoma congolense IL3000]|uniref:WGS project CAEQ00000000 data, annotated contig 234 n=1 Tax=Trypanosoma congolense (strain IL3000) TaxID=1068625 RepID=F9WDA2_TRYCI|nr:unnamed protein product [Trypanosoma congolense IL3000]
MIESGLSTEPTIVSLQRALYSLTFRLKQGTNNDGYFYLGGDGKNVCSGNNQNDVCVAYPGDGEKADISWAKRTDEALECIRKNIQQRTERQSSNPATNTRSKLGNFLGNDEHKGQSGPISGKNDEKDEDTEEKTEIFESQDRSQVERLRRKGSTQSSTETNIVSIATDTKEDGSFITIQKRGASCRLTQLKK